MARKLLFVVNPDAGTRQIRKHLPEVIRCFGRYGWMTTVCVTQACGDAARFAREYAGAADLVVCAGGDGTYSETLDGLIASGSKTPLGYIPAGSTNDFAAGLGLSTSILQAAEDIMTGRTQSVDAGLFGKRAFAYVAAFGAFTKTSYDTPQSAKNVFGHLAYLAGGVLELPSIHSMHVCLETADRKLEDDFIFGAVCNALSVGGVLSLDPGTVRFNDGFFEVLLARRPAGLAGVQEMIAALHGRRYEGNPMFEFFHTDSITIRTGGETDWAIDGEWCRAGGEVGIRVLKDAVTLLVPDETGRGTGVEEK